MLVFVCNQRPSKSVRGKRWRGREKAHRTSQNDENSIILGVEEKSWYTYGTCVTSRHVLMSPRRRWVISLDWISWNERLMVIPKKINRRIYPIVWAVNILFRSPFLFIFLGSSIVLYVCIEGDLQSNRACWFTVDQTCSASHKVKSWLWLWLFDVFFFVILIQNQP